MLNKLVVQQLLLLNLFVVQEVPIYAALEAGGLLLTLNRNPQRSKVDLITILLFRNPIWAT